MVDEDGCVDFVYSQYSTKPTWEIAMKTRFDTLPNLGIKTVTEAVLKAPELWRWLTTEWFSLRTHGQQPWHKRPIHPWWTAVTNSFGQAPGNVP
jgi:hypothetical protein